MSQDLDVKFIPALSFESEPGQYVFRLTPQECSEAGIALDEFSDSEIEIITPQGYIWLRQSTYADVKKRYSDKTGRDVVIADCGNVEDYTIADSSLLHRSRTHDFRNGFK